MMLEVRFANNSRETEYPMDNAEEFETKKEFIQFNIEQCREILHHDAEYARVIEKLEANEFETYRSEDVTYIAVTI